MAHHLAAILQQAKDAKGGKARKKAEAVAVDLILRLWERRRELPGGIYPLAPYEGLLRVLHRLTSRGPVWVVVRPRQLGHDAEEFYELFSLVTLGLLLREAGLTSTAVPLKPQSVRFLPKDERESLEAIQGALADFKERVQRRRESPADADIDIRQGLRELLDDAIAAATALRDELDKTQAVPEVAQTAPSEAIPGYGTASPKKRRRNKEKGAPKSQTH